MIADDRRFTIASLFHRTCSHNSNNNPPAATTVHVFAARGGGPVTAACGAGNSSGFVHPVIVFHAEIAVNRKS